MPNTISWQQRKHSIFFSQSTQQKYYFACKQFNGERRDDEQVGGAIRVDDNSSNNGILYREVQLYQIWRTIVQIFGSEY